jgi:hypothetical protein
MNFKRKISIELENELVQHYREHGFAASKIRCKEAGVSPKYAAGIASARGMARPLWRRGNRYKDSNVPLTSPIHHNDPRWKWAIKRGAVIA